MTMDQKDMPSDASKSNGHHDKRPLSPRDNATVSNSPKNSPREKQQRVDEKRNNVSPLPFAVAGMTTFTVTCMII